MNSQAQWLWCKKIRDSLQKRWVITVGRLFICLCQVQEGSNNLLNALRARHYAGLLTNSDHCGSLLQLWPPLNYTSRIFSHVNSRFAHVMVHGTLANMEHAEAYWSLPSLDAGNPATTLGISWDSASWRMRGHMKVATSIWGPRHASQATLK